MVLDYSIVKYLESRGDAVVIHYQDGKRILAYPEGRGLFLPTTATSGPPPGEYEPWEPPAEPVPPGEWLSTWADGMTITSPFGWRAGGFHYGVDLSSTTAPTGLPVLAVAEMVITVAVDAYEGGNQSGGTYVKGHTPDGAYTFTHYHGADESLAVAVGQTVPAGTVLFTEGATGNVTGTHLHFEIILGNYSDPWPPPYNNGAQFVDPLPILRDHGVTI